MKKIFLPFVACAALLIASCTNESDNDKTQVAELRTYVDSVSALDWTDANRKWEDVDVVFQERLKTVESRSGEFDETLRADYDKIKSDYEALRVRYNEQQALAAKNRLRNSLFGEGAVGNDLTFTFITPENASTVYERFVTTVDANGNTYTAAEWEEIRQLYSGLEGRISQLQLEAAEGKKIAAHKLKYDELKDRWKDAKDAAEDMKDAAEDAADDAEDAADDANGKK